MVKRKVIIKPGERFGMLTIIDEMAIDGVNIKRRSFLCSCECGSESVYQMNNLRSGRSTSCGCVRLDATIKANTTHNESKTRLYKCWVGMHERSKSRLSNGENCVVCVEWEYYEPFRHWAISNGYTDFMVLCRTGDIGGYNPSNVRWDTTQSNSEEAHALNYTFISPNGVVTDIFNMRKFCREHGLDHRIMNMVHHGKLKQHRGWTLNQTPDTIIKQ